jgi:hypothetical protein
MANIERQPWLDEPAHALYAMYCDRHDPIPVLMRRVELTETERQIADAVVVAGERVR